MGAVGLIGIALSLSAWPFALRRAHRNQSLLFVCLLILHIASSIIYYLYVQTAPADTRLYYYDFYQLRHFEFGFGTIFTVKLVQYLRSVAGGSYLDYFLLFQASGFWGIVILLRSFDEVQAKLSLHFNRLIYLVLFLPGLHFWTSAIGKDAPLLFAVSLAVWSTMRRRRRVAYLCIALGVMVLFRPHIALVTAATYALAELMEPGGSAARKAVLLSVFAVGIAVIAGTVQSTLQVDVTSASSVGEFLERQQSVGRQIAGTTAVVDAPFVVRLASLLFRPLFFDATGLFGVIASTENLAYLFIIGVVVANWRRCLNLARRTFALRFALIFAGFLAVLLSLVYYNVGLGARQKIMLVPPLFIVFSAVWSGRRDRRARNVIPIPVRWNALNDSHASG